MRLYHVLSLSVLVAGCASINAMTWPKTTREVYEPAVASNIQSAVSQMTKPSNRKTAKNLILMAPIVHTVEFAPGAPGTKNDEYMSAIQNWELHGSKLYNAITEALKPKGYKFLLLSKAQETPGAKSLGHKPPTQWIGSVLPASHSMTNLMGIGTYTAWGDPEYSPADVGPMYDAMKTVDRIIDGMIFINIHSVWIPPLIRHSDVPYGMLDGERVLNFTVQYKMKITYCAVGGQCETIQSLPGQAASTDQYPSMIVPMPTRAADATAQHKANWKFSDGLTVKLFTGIAQAGIESLVAPAQ